MTHPLSSPDTGGSGGQQKTTRYTKNEKGELVIPSDRILRSPEMLLPNPEQQQDKAAIEQLWEEAKKVYPNDINRPDFKGVSMIRQCEREAYIKAANKYTNTIREKDAEIDRLKKGIVDSVLPTLKELLPAKMLQQDQQIASLQSEICQIRACRYSHDQIKLELQNILDKWDNRSGRGFVIEFIMDFLTNLKQQKEGI